MKFYNLIFFLFLPAFGQSNLLKILGSNIYGEAAHDHSGWSVSLNGNGRRIAFGGPDNDGSGTDAGHVRVYQLEGGQWVQLGSDIDGKQNRELSGAHVSMSKNGKYIAVGAPYNDFINKDAGQVRLYNYDGNNWVQVGSDINGEAEDDFFTGAS